jgi:hypothetical protein
MSQNNNKFTIENINEDLSIRDDVLTKNYNDLNVAELLVLQNIDLEIENGELKVSLYDYENLKIVSKNKKIVKTTLVPNPQIAPTNSKKKVFIAEAFDVPQDCAVCFLTEENPLLMEECKTCNNYVHSKCFMSMLSSIATIDPINLTNENAYNNNAERIEKSYRCPSCKTPNFLDLPIPRPVKFCYVCLAPIQSMANRFGCSFDHFAHVECFDMMYKTSNYAYLMTCPKPLCGTRMTLCFACTYPITMTNDMYSCGDHVFHKGCTPQFKKKNPSIANLCPFGKCKKPIVLPDALCSNCQKPVILDGSKNTHFLQCPNSECKDWICINCSDYFWKEIDTYGKCQSCESKINFCFSCKKPFDETEETLTCIDGHAIHPDCQMIYHWGMKCKFNYRGLTGRCGLILNKN